MQSLAHYALLGSLLAGAAGAVVIAAVTLKHGFKRSTVIEDENPEDAERRQRMIRLADTVAVLCFAVSAGLGVVGLMQHTQTTGPAVVATEDTHLAERLDALEAKLSATSTPEWRSWEERLAQLENRLGAVEDRAAVAERRAIASEQLTREQIAREHRDARARTAPVTSAPRYVAPPVAKSPSLPASSPVTPPSPPRLSSPTEASVIPDTPAPAQPDVAPKAVASAPAALPREVVHPRKEPPPPPSLGDKIRRDWTTVKEAARRGGDEWRDGWDRVKGLFAR